jgi:hypothetical protein
MIPQAGVSRPRLRRGCIPRTEAMRRRMPFTFLGELQHKVTPFHINCVLYALTVA